MALLDASFLSLIGGRLSGFTTLMFAISSPPTFLVSTTTYASLFGLLLSWRFVLFFDAFSDFPVSCFSDFSAGLADLIRLAEGSRLGCVIYGMLDIGRLPFSAFFSGYFGTILLSC